MADRELMVRQAEVRAKTAEDRLRELEMEVERLRSSNGARHTMTNGTPDPDPRTLPPELLEALTGAIRSAAEQMSDHGAEAAGAVKEGGDPLHGLTAQHPTPSESHRPDPALAEAREKLQGVRDALRMLPRRLEEAFRPLARSVREAEEGLKELESRRSADPD